MAGELPPSWTTPGRASGDYYAPVTDLLLGVLFIFLILLTFFASQLQTSSEALTDTMQSRTKLLTNVQERLQEQGVISTIDTGEGVLSLSASEMFPQGSAELTEEGRHIVSALAGALMEELPCFAWQSAAPVLADCRHPHHSLSTVVIEGHTDSDPVRTTGWFIDNWDLSAGRASSTYRALTASQVGLENLLNGAPGTASAQTLFSVAGFADERAIAKGDSTADKARNRRIDIRFIMAPASQLRITPLPAYEAPDGVERPPVAYGRQLRFGSGLASSAYLAEGWWPPERWGIWAEQTDARLVLPLSSPPRGDLLLEIRGAGFVAEEAPNRGYEVLVGDRVVDEFTLSWPDNAINRQITIPARLLSGGDTLNLTLRADQLISPQGAGHSTDPRPLGFGLESIQLREIR